MPSAVIRCYAELNEHLPQASRFASFCLDLGGERTVADVADEIHIPRNEIDLVLVNGQPSGFETAIRDGDRLSLFPVFESFDISRDQRLRTRPLRSPRFILDVHLGKLARFLRMLGFDALYRPDFRDEDLVTISTAEGRTLLSKDRLLFHDGRITRGYRVKTDDPTGQLREVLARFDLAASANPLSRCLRCNTLLRPVAKESVVDRLPPRVRRAFNDFHCCPSCDRVYWQGSHYEHMRRFILTLSNYS